MNRKSTNFVYSAKGFEKSNCDEKAVEYDQLEYMLKKEKSLKLSFFYNIKVIQQKIS